jgi:peroxiredoxin Q/BCP
MQGKTRDEAQDEVKLTPGDAAPGFTLPDEDGTPVSLSDFAPARVVVYFYPKDDTPGCTTEARQFSELAEQFGRAKVPVVGISPDPPDRHRRFREKHGLTVRLLSDPDHAVMRRYGAFGEKTRYGRTSLGVIRSTFLVDLGDPVDSDHPGRIVRAWYNVRADGHAGKVLEAIRA